MFQKIQGKDVYVVDLKEMPPLPVHDGGMPALEPYAIALTRAIRTGVLQEEHLPGKFAIEINFLTNAWSIYRIDE